MKNANYDTMDGEEHEPHYTQGMTKGLYTYVYVNGDEHFHPKKLLVNPKRDRTYNAFLDYATKVLNPRYGAVRNIFTPEGKHRVRGFEDLRPEGRYVACGREPFKRLDRPYTQIESYSPRRRHRPLRDERVIPAHHNKYLENISGKINQIPTQGKFIEVFVNGKFDTPTTVGISYRQLENMDDTIKVIHEAITEKHQYRVDELCDVEGHPITRVDQIESGGLYVARKHYHQFQKGRYDPHGKKNIIIPLSPREKPPKYLWKERTLPPIHQQKKHSPDHSVSSYPETRKRNQVNGVPVKPAKHTKRTPKQADYDKDDGGVFKAKGQNRDTRGAREVRDTGDTKVDLPIDQVRAEEVKDERIKKEKQGKDSDTSGVPGYVPPPMHNARPAQNGSKPTSGTKDNKQAPPPGSDAKTSPAGNVKDNKGSDPNKKTDAKNTGPDLKPADTNTTGPDAKPAAGPDSKAQPGTKPAGGDKPPPGDTKPPVGDKKPPAGDNKPPAGDNKPPPGDNKPPAGDNKPPAGDNKPPAGDNKPPAGDNKPPAGDNKPPAGDNKPPAGENKAPNDSNKTAGSTDTKPVTGPDSAPSDNANT